MYRKRLWVLVTLILALFPATSAGADCPCTIFAPGDGPLPGASYNDGQPLEVGLKFRSSEDGHVHAVRFYKSPHAEGPHTVHLWTGDGRLLGAGQSEDESASGWQTVRLSAPVEIFANATYVASYHSHSGWYMFDFGYFATSVGSPPLRALADGEDGPNAVFAYGPSAFPSASYLASGYWVDVVFDRHPAAASPVLVMSRSPAADGAPVTTRVVASFSAPLDPASVDAARFELRGPEGDRVEAEVSYDSAGDSATLTPHVRLAPSTRYEARILGGEAGVRDLAGQPLPEDIVWSFTTDTRTQDPAPGDQDDHATTAGPPSADAAPRSAPCFSRRRFPIRVRLPAGSRASTVSVTLEGRPVAVRGHARPRAFVDLRRLPKGSYRVEIDVRLTTGRRLRGARTYRTCTPARRAARSPRL